MATLLKRARAAGLGLLLGTQTPQDLDPTCRQQILSWFVGRIDQINSLKRLQSLFEEARVNTARALPGQTAGEFHLIQEARVQRLEAQHSLVAASQLSSPQILTLSRQPSRGSG